MNHMFACAPDKNSIASSSPTVDPETQTFVSLDTPPLTPDT